MTSEDRWRAVTVAGPAGQVDLVCSAPTTVRELAGAYAERAGLCVVPLLHDRSGVSLAVDATLAALGIETGTILVATEGIVRHAPRHATSRRTGGDPRVVGGEGRRERRRRDVVSTGDGSGAGRTVAGGGSRR